MSTDEHPVVGFYVTGALGRKDFDTREEAEAAYASLAAPRAIGAWHERTREVAGRTQRSRYGELIDQEGMDEDPVTISHKLGHGYNSPPPEQKRRDDDV